MSLLQSFLRLPPSFTRRALPALRRFNLVRRLEVDLLHAHLPAPGGLRILDVGSGEGTYFLDLAIRGAFVAEMELLPRALSVVRGAIERLGLSDSAAALAGDVTSLPVAGESLDAIVCNCVLEHVADDDAALREMARALKPGGLLYLTVDCEEQPLILTALDRLPGPARRLLLRPEVAAARSVQAGLLAYWADLYRILRRYRCDELASRLAGLGFAIRETCYYPNRLGGAVFEAFSSLRGAGVNTGWARLAFMASSLLLGPWLGPADRRDPSARGYCLAIVAIKGSRGPCGGL